MAISFDGVNKLISLSSGTTTLNVLDLWSRWVDWNSTSDNSKYLPAFDTVGGNSIDAGAGTSIPIYLFLLNGWKIRPQEADHTLSVTSGVLLVDGGGDPFVNTLGNYNVRIKFSQPVQAVTVSTGGGGGATATEIREEMDANSTKLTSISSSVALIGTDVDTLITSGSTNALIMVEIYRLMGLDPTKPLIVTPTSRTAGAEIQQTLDQNGTTVTVTRS